MYSHDYSLTNLFVTEYIITRLNSVLLEKSQKQTTVHVKGFKVATVSSSETFYVCIRSEDIQKYRIYVKTAELELNSSNLSVHILEDIVVFWSANFHLKLLTLYREIVDFIGDVKRSFSVTETPVTEDRRMNWNLRMSGLFAFHIRISEKHDAKIAMGNTYYHIQTTTYR